jgi:hypothetical protein
MRSEGGPDDGSRTNLRPARDRIVGNREREPNAGGSRRCATDVADWRRLFGDVDLHTLDRLAAQFAIDDRTLARSYARARREVTAANSELDEFAAQFDL